MKRNIIAKLFILLTTPVIMASCEVFGLQYQDSYDFDYSAGIANNKVEIGRAHV